VNVLPQAVHDCVPVPRIPEEYGKASCSVAAAVPRRFRNGAKQQSVRRQTR